MTYLGLTTGPFLGGWLAERFGWHSVFFVNVPIGILATALAIAVIPPDEPPLKTERFDLAGAALFAVGLVALLFALDQGHSLGWASPAILGSLAIVVLGADRLHPARIKIGCADARSGAVWRSPLLLSTIAAVLNYVCVYSVLFLMPWYLIQGRGFPASQAGLILDQPALGDGHHRALQRSPFGSSWLTLAHHFGYAHVRRGVGRVEPARALQSIASSHGRSCTLWPGDRAFRFPKQ